jgi:hypothetical protein
VALDYPSAVQGQKKQFLSGTPALAPSNSRGSIWEAVYDTWQNQQFQFDPLFPLHCLQAIVPAPFHPSICALPHITTPRSP